MSSIETAPSAERAYLRIAELDDGAPSASTEFTERAAPRLVSPADLEWLEQGYATLLPLPPATESRFGGVVRDTLTHPGRLVRAQVAFALCRAMNIDRTRARELAIGVEYFHAASLIFDDLPAMDDARIRRGRLCPHVAHGEGAAILGALGFVNQGYALVWRALGHLGDREFQRAQALVAACLGVGGVLQGQALDLTFDRLPMTGARVLSVADGKTVPLVRLAIVLPAIAGGASDDELECLERLSTVWGRSYQILDDFKDCLAPGDETGKTGARDSLLQRPNLVLCTGHSRALQVLTAHLDEGRDWLARLEGSPLLDPAIERLHARLEHETQRVAGRIEGLRQAGSSR